jgi:hypothetical protein
VLNVTVPKTIHHEEIASDGTVTEWTTNETAVRNVPLYSYKQTVPFKRVCPTIHRTLFALYFISSRQKYIWRTDDHWVTCKGYLDNDKIKAHIEGKEIYGVRAGEYTNCIVIDLDLHNGSKDVITRQLEVILNHFHGSRKCHYSISRGGVHVIIILDKPTQIDAATAWLRKELETLDTQELKELALSHNMRPISDMEILPSRALTNPMPSSSSRNRHGIVRASALLIARPGIVLCKHNCCSENNVHLLPWGNILLLLLRKSRP